MASSLPVSTTIGSQLGASHLDSAGRGQREPAFGPTQRSSSDGTVSGTVEGSVSSAIYAQLVQCRNEYYDSIAEVHIENLRADEAEAEAAELGQVARQLVPLELSTIISETEAYCQTAAQIENDYLLWNLSEAQIKMTGLESYMQECAACTDFGDRDLRVALAQAEGEAELAEVRCHLETELDLALENNYAMSRSEVGIVCELVEARLQIAELADEEMYEPQHRTDRDPTGSEDLFKLDKGRQGVRFIDDNDETERLELHVLELKGELEETTAVCSSALENKSAEMQVFDDYSSEMQAEIEALVECQRMELMEDINSTSSTRLEFEVLEMQNELEETATLCASMLRSQAVETHAEMGALLECKESKMKMEFEVDHATHATLVRRYRNVLNAWSISQSRALRCVSFKAWVAQSVVARRRQGIGHLVMTMGHAVHAETRLIALNAWKLSVGVQQTERLQVHLEKMMHQSREEEDDVTVPMFGGTGSTADELDLQVHAKEPLSQTDQSSGSHASVSPVTTVKMTIRNVDLALLDEKAKADLNAEVVKSIATGAGVSESAVNVKLLPGSVKVRAEVVTPVGRSVESVHAAVSEAGFTRGVLSAVRSHPVVKRVATGPIEVYDLEVGRRYAEDRDRNTVQSRPTSDRAGISSQYAGIREWLDAQLTEEPLYKLEDETVPSDQLTLYSLKAQSELVAAAKLNAQTENRALQYELLGVRTELLTETTVAEVAQKKLQQVEQLISDKAAEARIETMESELSTMRVEYVDAKNGEEHASQYASLALAGAAKARQSLDELEHQSRELISHMLASEQSQASCRDGTSPTQQVRRSSPIPINSRSRLDNHLRRSDEGLLRAAWHPGETHSPGHSASPNIGSRAAPSPGFLWHRGSDLGSQSNQQLPVSKTMFSPSHRGQTEEPTHVVHQTRNAFGGPASPQRAHVAWDAGPFRAPSTPDPGWKLKALEHGEASPGMIRRKQQMPVRYYSIADDED